MIAYAQEGTELAHSFVAQLNAVILFPLIALLTTLAILVFLWGGFQYVYNANSDQGRATGRSHMLWGIIGLLVMLSAYAILTIAGNTFGLDVDQYRQPGGDSSFNTSGSQSSNLDAFAPTESLRPQARPNTGDTTNDTDNTVESMSQAELQSRVNSELQASNPDLNETEIDNLTWVLTEQQDSPYYSIIKRNNCDRGYLSTEVCAQLP